jgi:hypothetical protein
MSKNCRRNGETVVRRVHPGVGVLHAGGIDAFSTQPPQKPALQQLGVEPVGFRPAMFP